MEEIPILKAIREASKIAFWKERVLLALLVMTLLLNLFLWLFVYLNYRNLKEITILHYSVLPGIGINQLGNKIYLFNIPLTGLIIFLFNLVLTNFLFKKGEKLLGYFLTSTSFLANLSLLVSAILILSL